MGETWRTDEPEQGQIAQIVDDDGKTHFALAHNGNGLNEFGWETSAGWFDFHQIKMWLPITTPEEARLRARIVELESGVERLRDAARWRKWPEEVPDRNGLCVTTGYHFGLNYYHLTDGWQNPQVVWWKAIGPLPGE